jgi:hypothetical protein
MLLIGGRDGYEYGEDAGEVVIENAKILDIIKYPDNDKLFERVYKSTRT